MAFLSSFLIVSTRKYNSFFSILKGYKHISFIVLPICLLLGAEIFHKYSLKKEKEHTMLTSDCFFFFLIYVILSCKQFLQVLDFFSSATSTASGQSSFLASLSSWACLFHNISGNIMWFLGMVQSIPVL